MIDTEIPKTLEPSAPAPEKPASTITLPIKIIPLRRENDDFSTKTELEMRDAPQEERQRFNRVLEGARALGEMRTRFWNMLVESVAKTGHTPPQDRPTEILDLACL